MSFWKHFLGVPTLKDDADPMLKMLSMRPARVAHLLTCPTCGERFVMAIPAGPDEPMARSWFTKRRTPCGHVPLDRAIVEHPVQVTRRAEL